MRLPARFLQLCLILAALVVIWMALCMFGFPFDSLPFRTFSSIKVVNRVWLSYVPLPHGGWEWGLMLNPDPDQVAPWWDPWMDVSSGIGIIGPVSQYQAVRPWLIIAQYQSHSGASRWHLLDLSKGYFNYCEQDFGSRAELEAVVRSYGITEILSPRAIPTPSAITTGEVSSLIIVCTLLVTGTSFRALGKRAAKRAIQRPGFEPIVGDSGE